MAIELRITSSYPYYTHTLWFIDRKNKLKIKLAQRYYRRHRGSLVKIARSVMKSIGGRWYDRMNFYEIDNKPHAIKLD